MFDSVLTLRNLADETLKRELVEEKISLLLILADLTQCNRTRTVSVRLKKEARW